MPIPGKLLTTAMAVMPHIDVDQALDAALSYKLLIFNIDRGNATVERHANGATLKIEFRSGKLGFTFSQIRL